MNSLRVTATVLVLTSLVSNQSAAVTPTASATVLQPKVISEAVRYDSDDPAIWINHGDPSKSLILGTDKDSDGALFVFGLDGKIRPELTVRGLVRPNNVDVAYGVMVGGRKIDIAVVAERFAHRVRVFSLPDLRPVDGGGIPVFEGERARDVMGIASYTRPSDDALFVVVSRSARYAPKDGYLHQYRIVDDGSGVLRGVKARAFGEWSGNKEIEALSVDSVAGLIFASDETFGIRVYHADPAAKDADDEITQFGLNGFTRDHEGSAVFRRANMPPLLFVSDQQAGELRAYRIDSTSKSYDFAGRVKIAAAETDGIDITTHALPGFPSGLLVAMSADRTYHFYDLDSVLRGLSFR